MRISLGLLILAFYNPVRLQGAADELDLFSTVDEICRVDEETRLQLIETQLGFEIVGGTTEFPDRYPYLVSLQQINQEGDTAEKYQHICGGTLIAPQVVLTAAHCILTLLPSGRSVLDLRQRSQDGNRGNLKPDTLYASLNPFCRHQSGNFGRVIVQEYAMHPLYDGIAELGNDVAVVYLEKEFEGYAGPYVDYQSAIFVDLQDDEEEFTVMGWGATDANDIVPARFIETVSPLQSTQVTYLDVESCNSTTTQISPDLQVVPGQMICFQDRTRFSDSCSGDSGGPVILSVDDGTNSLNSSMDIQVGLTSWGPDFWCSGLSGFPGVYTHLAEYVNWIDSVITLPP